MESLFLVFAIMSCIGFIDGMLLKNGRIKEIIIKNIHTDDASERVALISKTMVATSIAALIWTAIGYALYIYWP